MDAGPPSCLGLAPTCGIMRDEGCCATTTVPSGSFLRDYDGVDSTDNTLSASISAFVLDKFEVSVSRFRRFVTASVAGWKPATGSGKHSYLNGGRGLVAIAGGYEGGWGASWTSSLPATAAQWASDLECPTPTWTASPGANEDLPISCVNWYQAYAFCIWDGGVLPSDSEWNYVASGGSEQRVYPWSTPATSTTIDCTYANSMANDVSCSGSAWAVGSRSPKGDGKWGQADLAGNLREWTLDWAGAYGAPCIDCANLSDVGVNARAVRGGAFDLVDVRVAVPDVGEPGDNASAGDFGVRCARAP